MAARIDRNPPSTIANQLNAIASDPQFTETAKKITYYVTTGKGLSDAQKAIRDFLDKMLKGQFLEAVNGNVNRTFVDQDYKSFKNKTEDFLKQLKNLGLDYRVQDSFVRDELNGLGRLAQRAIQTSNCANFAGMS